jgi:hypothetical protein
MRRDSEAAQHWASTLRIAGRCARLGVPVTIPPLPRKRGLRSCLQAEAKFDYHLRRGLELALEREPPRRRTLVRNSGTVLRIY